jgi:hypothetical protein
MLCGTGQLDSAFFVPTGFCSSTHAYQTRQWDKALTFQASALNSAGRISARCIESFFASRISWWNVNRGSLPVCLRRLASILPSVQSIAIMFVRIAECRDSFDYQKFPPHPHAPGLGRIGCDGASFSTCGIRQFRKPAEPKNDGVDCSGQQHDALLRDAPAAIGLRNHAPTCNETYKVKPERLSSFHEGRHLGIVTLMQ